MCGNFQRRQLAVRREKQHFFLIGRSFLTLSLHQLPNTYILILPSGYNFVQMKIALSHCLSTSKNIMFLNVCHVKRDDKVCHDKVSLMGYVKGKH